MPNSFGRRKFVGYGVSLLTLTGLSLIGCESRGNRASSNQLQSSDRGEKTMKLESSAFSHEGMIPTKYTCDGADISPALSWRDVPEGTQSLALICDDPDAPGMTFVHWIIYNLAPDTQQLPEDVPKQEQLDNGALQGQNNFGKVGYGGPCPPGGTHRYFFRLYALDQMLNLEAGVNRDQLDQAMEGHILAQAELMGQYSRKG